MALEVNNLSLFGLDLRSFGRVWRNGWYEALQWPAFAWLSPSETVRVVLPDGSEVLRQGVSARPARHPGGTRAVAVVVPDDSILVRELVLPRLAIGELQQALALEVAAVSPFSVDDTVWGWSAESSETRTKVRLALAARKHVDAAIESVRLSVASAEPEVWALADAPILLQGYGEHARLKRVREARGRMLWALVGAVVLAIGAASVPAWQARARVFDAQMHYEQLESQVAGLIAARAALTTGNERARALRAHVSEHQDIPLLLEILTRTLSDDVFLSRLEVKGRQVRIVGQASNASQLMNALGAQASPFRDVRAPSPISRAAGSDKENFVIEFVVPVEGTQP